MYMLNKLSESESDIFFSKGGGGATVMRPPAGAHYYYPCNLDHVHHIIPNGRSVMGGSIDNIWG